MIPAAQFIKLLEESGFDFFTGVPCSLFCGAIQILEQRKDLVYIPAVREDDALGIASGAYLGGRRPAVLIQNSGLGNCLNVITSLNIIYKIPVLIVMTWRGFGGIDAPEHIVMGKNLERLLADVGLPYRILAPETLAEEIRWAADHIRKEKLPAVLLLKKGVLCNTG
jgi:sulfopyruvate decarboxylase alpha subunit